MESKTTKTLSTMDINQIAQRIQQLGKEINSASLSLADKNILKEKIGELIIRLESLKTNLSTKQA